MNASIQWVKREEKYKVVVELPINWLVKFQTLQRLTLINKTLGPMWGESHPLRPGSRYMVIEADSEEHAHQLVGNLVKAVTNINEFLFLNHNEPDKPAGVNEVKVKLD